MRRINHEYRYKTSYTHSHIPIIAIKSIDIASHNIKSNPYISKLEHKEVKYLTFNFEFKNMTYWSRVRLRCASNGAFEK